jgi:adenosylcobinamide-GDP ribazoletransferase
VRAALSFLTPFGGARTPTPRAVAWFPVVGALLGLALGLVWELAWIIWFAPVAAAVVVIADLALTGMLHADGLADSADGLLPHLDRARRLEVMAQPDIGAFGATVLAATMLLRWACLLTLDPDATLLVALWITSRSIMAIGLSSMDYARDSGLASAFRGGNPWAAFAGPVVALLLVHDIPRGTAVAGAVMAGTGILLLAERRIGGFTGDVLGAAGVVAETVGLLVACATW